MSGDRFLNAWGETAAWRGVHHQARLLAALPAELMSWAPAQALLSTRAIGQATALRHFLAEESETMLPTLRLASLHRAFEALRLGRRGPRRWRRYWWLRALAYAPALADEQHDLALARNQLGAWLRAIDLAEQGLAEQRALPWPEDRPAAVSVDWEFLHARLRDASDGLAQTRTRVCGMIEGVDRLRQKIEGLLDASHALPKEEGDVLDSAWFAQTVSQALAVPTSKIAGSHE